MKRFLLYSAATTTVFLAGAATATYVVGKVLIPVVDTKLAVDKIMLGYDKAQRKVMGKFFGTDTKIELQPRIIDGVPPRSDAY